MLFNLILLEVIEIESENEEFKMIAMLCCVIVVSMKSVVVCR